MCVPVSVNGFTSNMSFSLYLPINTWTAGGGVKGPIGKYAGVVST